MKSRVLSCVAALAAVCTTVLVTAPSGAVAASHSCVTVTAHRGSGPGTTLIRGLGLRSEDTIPAFYSAYNRGAGGFETDYQMTRDHQLVSLHDPTVDRMTRAHGSVGSMTVRQVTRLRTPSGAPIPTHLQVMKATAKFGGWQQQELKPNGYPLKVLKHLLWTNAKYLGDPYSKVLYTASERSTLAQVQKLVRKRYDHDALTGLIMRSPTGRFNLHNVNPKVVSVLMLDYRALSRNYVKQAHKAGFLVSARSVNTVATQHRMEALGVDRIVTDNAGVVHSHC